MDTARIAELLQPFLTGPSPRESGHSERSEESVVLTSVQLGRISTYIDLLLHWNGRVNLTAIRQPEEIVTRHFGESLFAARQLFPIPNTLEQPRAAVQAEQSAAGVRLIDVGSGAGFPGIPIKVWVPDVNLTLIESNHRKATFLREVSRALTLTDIDVFAGRAEDYPNPPAKMVTLRAVERFEASLPIAAKLVAAEGRLALLIGDGQLARAKDLTPGFAWDSAIPMPLSSNRIFALGVRQVQASG